MRWPHFLTMIAAGFLAACTSTPIDQGQRSSTTVDDPRATYKRSKPQAPIKAVTFQEFGFLEGQQLSLTLNETLAGQQVYEYCDQKPVDVSPAWQMPRCELMGFAGCRVYEAVRGQQPPACKITNKFGPCLLSEPPQPPPKQFGMTNDCYMVQADPDVLGRIGVYAVPEGTPRSETVSRGRRVASVALRPGASQTVTIPPQAVSSEECLALVDTRANVIGLRGLDTGPSSHLFATPQMTAERKMRDLRRAADQGQAQTQEVIGMWKRDVDKYVRALKANSAWDGQRCVELPMERLPPEPKGLLSSEEIEFEAKGYCAALLATLIGPNEVLNAIAASQEFDYRSSGFRLGMDPTHAVACTHKSHFFSPADIDRINVETGRAAPDDSNLSSRGTKGIPEYQQDSSGAAARRHVMISALLRQCTANAVDVCSAPRRQWVLETDRIKEAPQLALNSCETDFQALRIAVQSLQKAELEASLSKPAPRPTPTRIKPERGRVTLSAAICGKVPSK